MTAPVIVSVYQPDGTTPIGTILAARGQQWVDELNTPGSGQFGFHLDTPVLDGLGAPIPLATLLTDRNVVRFIRTADAAELKRWRLSAFDPTTIADKTDRWCTVSGLGLLADFELVIVFPEIPDQATTTDVRAFNFSSPAFTAIRNPAEWVTPFGVRQDSDPTARGTYPRPWFDGAAQWIWSSDPTVSAPIGRNWFLGEFTLTDPVEIALEAAADNYAEVWLDGERIILMDPTDPFGWKQQYPYSRTLAAGRHVVGAAVDNWALSDGANNPGGFLCDVYSTDADGQPVALLLRTNTTDWKVKAYGDPPGWTFGDILVTLIAEAQARGDADVDAFTLGFTGALDSNGNPWPGGIQDTTLRIGDDLLKVVNQATEVACDIWADGFVLHAAPHRGTDRTGTVTYTTGVDVMSGTPTFKGGPTRNAALVRYANRFVLVEDATSIAAHGRREVYLQAGDAGSSEQATATAETMFVDTATPEITIPLQVTSVVGSQLETDYFIGDDITAPGLFGDPSALRVMSATGSVNDTVIVYDLDLYPV